MWEFERFQDDKHFQDNICVFETLEKYIFRAKLWREKSNHIQLLLSRIETHYPVKTCTLSLWIFQVLKYAGRNTKMFTSHSVRVASTSKAKTLVYLSVKFSKRFSDPKNQHGKSSIIERYFQK